MGVLSIAAHAADKAAPDHANSAAKGECHGVNACKGQGDCHGAGKSCAGSNECKGKGWKSMTEAECKAKAGKFVASK